MDDHGEQTLEENEMSNLINLNQIAKKVKDDQIKRKNEA